ncbi:hypothetical protein N781_17040 [Pontibacillus halophilus JSM 076056 = DSM 19796]|uniref:Glycosyltransferase 2-like domain-containing protein n=1 Tax=Pontibacillus halophilus JSM 076056 = DSM 19796 TaxID=1385510 RepID=A0A0A5GKP7_9BACI|nr:glycosyltransferase [Pontibacillus halophilus]KGX92519.1 hypothetical protein N781_17040 [Pontibacillus halophilus JSM 076056 = DSM 19796]
MKKNTIGIIISTTATREKVLEFTVASLCKDTKRPFTLYIYNDLAAPLYKRIRNIIDRNRRPDIELVVLNDSNEHSKVHLGCGGGRHILFERAKSKHPIVISLDDDMQLKKGWVEAVITAMGQFPNYHVYTGIVRNRNRDIEIAGTNFSVRNGYLYRTENQVITNKYMFTDWGPIGCIALRGKALLPQAQIPPTFTRDDAIFFMNLKKLNANQTVVVRDAEAIHKPIPVPATNLRSDQHMKEADQYLKAHHGLNFP